MNIMKRTSVVWWGLMSLATIMNMTSCNSDAAAPKAGAPSAVTPMENILTRTSVRTYEADHTITPDTVEMLLRAAMSAPTARNSQPWEFVVLDTRESLDSLAEALPYAKMLRQAPLAIVTCGNMERALDGEGRGFWIQDVSAATENLLLAAHALGLGAVWTGVFPSTDRTAAVQQRLGLPPTVIPLAVVPVGYPAGENVPKDKWHPERIHTNRW